MTKVPSSLCELTNKWNMLSSVTIGRKSVKPRKSKRATILQLGIPFIHLFHPIYGSEVHLAAKLYISQPRRTFFTVSCCLHVAYLRVERKILSQSTVSRWTPAVCEKGLCGSCRWTAVATGLETHFMETSFLAGSCNVCYGIGRVWKIEESMSDYSLWKQQETGELEVTNASFLKSVSKLS